MALKLQENIFKAKLLKAFGYTPAEEPASSSAEESSLSEDDKKASNTIKKINDGICRVTRRDNSRWGVYDKGAEILNFLIGLFGLHRLGIPFAYRTVGGVQMNEGVCEPLKNAETLQISCHDGKFHKYTAEEMVKYCQKVTTVKFCIIDEKKSKGALDFLEKNGVKVEILSEKMKVGDF